MSQYYLHCKKADFKRIAETFSISPMLARIIRNRDITEDAEIEEYLNGGTDRLHDPFLLKGMEEAVPLLYEAIRTKQRIRVIGDYDTDGVMASHILCEFFTCLGGICDVRLPDRVAEGYGMNPAMVQEAAKDGVSLIVTVDNGVASYEAASEAKALGIRLIISDHHEVSLPLPEAEALIDAKQPDCTYPYRELCGAGIAYKIVCAMYERWPKDFKEADREAAKTLLTDLLQYAGIATIADVVPLTGENRIIAAKGLEKVRKTENTGLKALIKVRQIDSENISSYHIGFILAPCLNSAGRLENAEIALELLSEPSEERAKEIAEHLSRLNDERKTMTTEQTTRAEQIVHAMGQIPKILVVYLPDAHESIAGIIAGRIKETFSRPALVITNGENGLKGSGRSVEAYPMITELKKHAELFEKLGGHAKAAGFTLKSDITPEQLSAELNAACTQTEEELCEKKWIDMELPFRYVTEGFVEELKRLEPFGLKNERPLFAAKNVLVKQVSVLGKENHVLKMNLESEEGETICGIQFGAEARITKEAEQIAGKRISLVFRPEVNEFRNRKTMQIKIQDVLSVCDE